MVTACVIQERAASGVECSEEEAVAVLKQGLRDSNFALEACQDQVRLREEEVQDLSQHLQAAQADISSLQVQSPILHARCKESLLLQHVRVHGFCQSFQEVLLQARCGRLVRDQDVAEDEGSQPHVADM